MKIILAGVGAGIAAALLFASLATGAVISMVLFYLAPLPILIVALGWSHWAGLIAALVAAAGLSALVKSYLFAAFLLGFGLPAWWLSYLALLARPVATSSGTVLEWYPIGRLLLWIAILSALIVVAGVLALGTTEDSIRASLRGTFELILRRQNPFSVPGADPNYQVETLVAAAPPAAAISVTFISVITLWLAARIVKVSNRLRRPWPDLALTALPPLTSALLGLAILGVLLAGLVGLLSGIFAASLATAYAILGFAVLHAITRGMNVRGLLLSLAYVGSVMISPVLLLIALLGLADSFLDIRSRFGPQAGPPTLRT
jgi:hypothetical protein